jgi:hypothetical protein
VARGEFDPDELARRLYIVLAEQQTQAERKRLARGEPSEPRESSTRCRDGSRKPGSEGRQEAAEASADHTTEKKRSKSAKHKPSPTVVTEAAPDATRPQEGEQHYVPKEAAKQFTRTTTVDNMRNNTNLVHKLSRHALKFHLEGDKTTRPGVNEAAVAPPEFSRALRRSQSQRDKLFDRNQFQRSRILDEAAQMDRETQQHHRHSAHKQTLEGELSRIKSGEGRSNHHHHQQAYARRNSTGSSNKNDLFEQRAEDNNNNNRRSFMLMEPLIDAIEDVEDLPPEESCSHYERRVDWTQSDESRARRKLHLAPLLRKADSLWTLRGRIAGKGSSSSSSAHEKGVGAEEQWSPKSPKSPRAGFFAKFKR